SATARQHVGSEPLDELPRIVGPYLRGVDLVGVEMIARSFRIASRGHGHGCERVRRSSRDRDRDIGSAFWSGLEEAVAARIANLAHRDLQVFGLLEVDGQ